MIGLLRGRIARLEESRLLIDVGGVGYLVNAGSRLLGVLSPGMEAELYVETIMSDSSIALFGFASVEEQLWFVKLRSVPGVGSRVALGIIDALGAGNLADSIATGDAEAIRRAKGVGRKLAERVISEFANKTDLPVSIGKLQAPESATAMAVSALINLGYGRSEALKAIAAINQPDAGEALLIREALKLLGKS